MTPVIAQSAERGSFFPTNRDESLRQQNSPAVALLLTRQRRCPKCDRLLGRQTLYCLSGLNADPARTEAQQPPLPTFWMQRHDGAGPKLRRAKTLLT